MRSGRGSAGASSDERYRCVGWWVAAGVSRACLRTWSPRERFDECTGGFRGTVSFSRRNNASPVLKEGKQRAAAMLGGRAGDGGVSCDGPAGISRVWGRFGSLREAMSSQPVNANQLLH